MSEGCPSAYLETTTSAAPSVGLPVTDAAITTVPCAFHGHLSGGRPTCFAPSSSLV